MKNKFSDLHHEEVVYNALRSEWGQAIRNFHGRFIVSTLTVRKSMCSSSGSILSVYRKTTFDQTISYAVKTVPYASLILTKSRFMSVTSTVTIWTSTQPDPVDPSNGFPFAQGDQNIRKDDNGGFLLPHISTA